MKNLRFICAQPCTTYYIWQVEVLIHNFMEMGVNPNFIDIIGIKVNGDIPDDWKKMAEKYNYVRFFFYDDIRKYKNYISSVRPNVLKQHWIARPELKDETIFYHDCDIAFTKPISEWITSEMINNNLWYGSDCRWYISHSYIKSKGEDILSAMCKLVDIDEEIVKKNELNGIGAQYIMKGIDENFWQKVEDDSEKLFTNISELNRIKKEENTDYHELQIWCADMWALLWNAWKLGYRTMCDDNLQFSWGTSMENLWNEYNIFHNAGVVNSTSGFFYKADFTNKLPYGADIKINEGTSSYEYWKLIQKVGKKSILI